MLPLTIFALLLLFTGCAADRAEETNAQRTAVEEAAETEADPPSDPPPPSGPPKRIFTKRFVATVRVAPSRDAARVGYLRAGAVLQATTAEPVGNDGCRRGWYELTTGGFVCSGSDVIAFEGSRLPALRMAQPNLDAKLPYQYGFVRSSAPMYRRLPTDEEAMQHEGYRPPGMAAPSPTADPGATASGDPATGPAPGTNPAPDAVVAPAPAADPTPAVEPTPAADPTRAVVADPASPTGAPDAGGPPTLADLLHDRESVVMRTMMRGFYVSLDRELERGPRRYWRTQGNGFLPSGRLLLREGSDFQGVALDEEGEALPVGFLMSRSTVTYRKLENGRFRATNTRPGYHYSFRIVGQEEHGGRVYYLGSDGQYFRDRDVRRIDARPRPEGVGESEKWIDVDLALQSLVAYEGDRPVYVTLISSGRIKNENIEELNHATPTGEFRITSKHLTHTMDGDNAFDGPYSVDDVPYVMYFQLAYAIHSAFWHDSFGRPKSHGCVNLAPLDARWMYRWAGPDVPDGWHGGYPTEQNPGTRLFIRGETPHG